MAQAKSVTVVEESLEERIAKLEKAFVFTTRELGKDIKERLDALEADKPPLMTNCEWCNGSGDWPNGKPCPHCNGTGQPPAPVVKNNIARLYELSAEVSQEIAAIRQDADRLHDAVGDVVRCPSDIERLKDAVYVLKEARRSGKK